MATTNYVRVLSGKRLYSRNESARIAIRAVTERGTRGLRQPVVRPQWANPESGDLQPATVKLNLVRNQEDEVVGAVIPSGLHGGHYVFEIEASEREDVEGEGELVLLDTQDHEEYWSQMAKESVSDPEVCRGITALFTLARQRVNVDLTERMNLAGVWPEWMLHDRRKDDGDLVVSRGMFAWGVTVVAEIAFERVCWGGGLSFILISEGQKLIFRCLSRTDLRTDEEWLQAVEPFRLALPERWSVSVKQDDDLSEIELEFSHGAGSSVESLVKIERVRVPVFA